MELWLRYQKALNLEYDEKITVTSQEDWHSLIYNPELISSVLWPEYPRFPITSRHIVRRHSHEVSYANKPERNLSYREACLKIARKMESELRGSRCLIYAPLRGSLPIWRCIHFYLTSVNCTVYYPVTSSFINYPPEFNIIGKGGRPASGRRNNKFELERLKPFLNDFDYFVYVDELVSGGMMRGHLKEIFGKEIHKQIKVVAVGLADAFGLRFKQNLPHYENWISEKKLHSFIWEGCSQLITEDQKFLLGIHYTDYNLGPHVVPLITDELEFYQEKKDFDKDVYNGAVTSAITI